MSSMPSSCRRNSDWMASHSAGSALAMVCESGNIRREVPERTKILSEAFDHRTVFGDGEVREAQFFEPGEARFAPFQHRDCRGAARDEAALRLHGDRLQAARAAAGARIEDVAVALAVHLDEALVIAAGGDGAGHDGNRREQLVPAPRMLDAHAPRRAARL